MIEPEVVVVRVFGGTALVRWMVSTTGNVAYITTSGGVRAIESGQEPPAIGFPRSDVFRQATGLEGVRDGETPDWAGLEPRF